MSEETVNVDWYGLLALLLMRSGPIVVSEDEALSTTSNIFTIVTEWDEETKTFTMEAR